MSKQETTIIKGIAILMMLWGHLFVNPDKVAVLSNLLPQVQGVPFATWISRLMPPVPFFLMLSGYGMYIVNSKADKDVHRFSRILKLYFAFWVVLSIFVPIGHWVHPAEYPGSWLKLFGNLSGINASYNTAMWFLLPYILMALSAKYLIDIFNRLSHKIGVWSIICGVYVISTIISWWISRHTTMLNSYRLLYIAAEYLALLSPFMIGIFAAKYDVFTKIKRYSTTHTALQHLAPIALLLLFAVMLAIKVSIFTSAYVCAFIALWQLMNVPALLNNCLHYIGRYSMIMWMVHSYFYAYLFGSFVYGFRTPILIFAVLVGVSLLSAIIIQKIVDALYPVANSLISQLISNSRTLILRITENLMGGGGK